MQTKPKLVVRSDEVILISRLCTIWNCDRKYVQRQIDLGELPRRTTSHGWTGATLVAHCPDWFQRHPGEMKPMHRARKMPLPRSPAG